MFNPHVQLGSSRSKVSHPKQTSDDLPDDETSWDDIYEIIDQKSKETYEPEAKSNSDNETYLDPRPPPRPPTEYTVLYNFAGMDENGEPYTDALICTAGDIVYDAENGCERSPDWTRVYSKNSCKHGYVPSLYIETNSDSTDSNKKCDI